MLRVIRIKRVEFQVDKGARDLNEAFVEEIIAVRASQPEMLEHIMRFVVLSCVKARKIALITRIQCDSRIRLQLLDKGGEPFAFLHRRRGTVEMLSKRQ